MKNKLENIEITEITIDELAAMTARGFAEVDKNFDKFSERFDGLERKIDNLATAVQNGFNTVNGRIDGIYFNYVTLREHKVLADRVKKLEGEK